MRELNGDHVPETEEYGISSTVFRAELPFRPGRLWTSATEELDSGAYGQLLRSKEPRTGSPSGERVGARMAPRMLARGTHESRFIWT